MQAVSYTDIRFLLMEKVVALMDGKSAKQIAIELNAAGIATRLAYKQAKGEQRNRQYQHGTAKWLPEKEKDKDSERRYAYMINIITIKI